MENENNNILIIGQYGSGKTTFLMTLYNFFMRLKPIEIDKFENKQLRRLLEGFKFDEYEVIYICASPDRDLSVLFLESINPLLIRVNMHLNNLYNNGIQLLEKFHKLNPETKILILLDELEMFLTPDNNIRFNNLSFLQLLAETAQANANFKLIVASQKSFIEEEFRLFKSRFFTINI